MKYKVGDKFRYLSDAHYENSFIKGQIYICSKVQNSSYYFKDKNGNELSWSFKEMKEEDWWEPLETKDSKLPTWF